MDLGDAVTALHRHETLQAFLCGDGRRPPLPGGEKHPAGPDKGRCGASLPGSGSNRDHSGSPPVPVPVSDQCGTPARLLPGPPKAVRPGLRRPERPDEGTQPLQVDPLVGEAFLQAGKFL